MSLLPTLLLIPILLLLPLLLLTYHLPLKPSHLSLSHIPPITPLAQYTTLPINIIRYMRWENRILASAHAKHGAVIRLGPKEVSVNAIKGGVREVYSGGYEKDTWYTFFGNYGYVHLLTSQH